MEAKAVLEKRIAEEAAGKSQKEAEQIAGSEKINVTDPDAVIMEQANGERNPAYSVTTSTDVGGDIITHFQVNEQDEQQALIPDRRLEAEQRNETAKGEYDRPKFLCDERTDSYVCPWGMVLERVWEVLINGRKHVRYASAEACEGCEFRGRCTKGKQRMIFRDQNEEVQERMREVALLFILHNMMKISAWMRE